MYEHIKNTLPHTLKQKNVQHKERFSEIFKARYLEIIPSLIKYKNTGEREVNVDWLKVEIALRHGFYVVIGETTNNDIQILGWANSRQTSSHPNNLFSENILKSRDINFTIPPVLRLKHYEEITNLNGVNKGNFVVLRNKTINHISDYEILEHYTDELSEIVLSRFSIIMQVKINTIFFGDPNDQTIQDLISEVYNGNPYLHMTKLFDPADNIYQFNNAGISSNFQELKREYQNKISELNNMLGINSLAVEKSSGVSDTEAESNRAYTTSNANIYLDSRNHALEKLNKRYNTGYVALYNDDVISEIQSFNNYLDKAGETDDYNS